jgi:pimeloyl-ACP methyl ester carboxylesterase
MSPMQVRQILLGQQPARLETPGTLARIARPGRGAGGTAWYWHRIVPLLQEAGHDAVAVNLPSADPAAGLDEYASVVAEASAGYHDIVLVAESMGGFTAPLAAALIPVGTLVFVKAMIPAPGETP